MTEKAAKKLKETLVDAYLESAGLGGSVGEETRTSVSHSLLRKCRESRVGFRLTMKDEGELLIGMGKPRNGDSTFDARGILIFADQTSTALLGTHQLDYAEGPACSFVLRPRP